MSGRALAARCCATLLALALLASPPPAAASPAPTYQVRPGDSVVEYTIVKWGVFHEQGRFRRFAGVIGYDPAHPEWCWTQLTVEVASIDSGIGERDETLLSDDFFAARQYPQMRFVSRGVRRIDGGSLLLVGELTIRDRTRRIEVPVRVLGIGRGGHQEVAGFDARFAIDRRDFGVLGSKWSGGQALLADRVEIHLQLGAERAREAVAPGARR
ncbi:MAG TPA: YceI family protein [Thermoanaerobaculia bacterium]|nr:YceI family protein [Thermoanaerobaculia bacterium]